MKIRQWEIWKAKPEGFATEHWFVVISAQERLDNPRLSKANGLACFTLRDAPLNTDTRLNSADGFETATVCQCVFFYSLSKSELRDCLGSVTWERQQKIKSKVREVLRLEPS
jgi:hypothetical protein